MDSKKGRRVDPDTDSDTAPEQFAIGAVCTTDALRTAPSIYDGCDLCFRKGMSCEAIAPGK